MYVGANEPFEAVFGDGTAGLVGTVEVAVQDGDGNTVIGPTSANITEEIVSGVPTGVYTWNAAAAPGTLGQYTILWSPDGTWDPNTTSSPDDLVVVESSAGPLPPIPPPVDGGPDWGPASAWTTGAAVALCCNAEVGTDTSVFDDAITSASQLLFALSGRQFFGVGSKTVRPPCRPGCGCDQVLSRGYVIPAQWWNWDWWGIQEGPCDPSRVLLSGYPVREITQIKIDGDILAADEYGLWKWRWLVRKNDEVWPRCQDLSLDDTEDGTWSVAYTYGQNPPGPAQDAAIELACEIYKSCTAQDCAMPTGVTRIVRQGVVIERLAFTAWGLQDGIWRTGLPRVDAFLNAFASSRIQRRATIWSPTRRLQYPRRSLT